MLRENFFSRPVSDEVELSRGASPVNRHWSSPSVRGGRSFSEELRIFSRTNLRWLLAILSAWIYFHTFLKRRKASLFPRNLRIMIYLHRAERISPGIMPPRRRLPRGRLADPRAPQKIRTRKLLRMGSNQTSPWHTSSHHITFCKIIKFRNFDEEMHTFKLRLMKRKSNYEYWAIKYTYKVIVFKSPDVLIEVNQQTNALMLPKGSSSSLFNCPSRKPITDDIS